MARNKILVIASLKCI